MTDRRVQRTRELLQKALTELIFERDYDGVTIQDIAGRANVGRTTFYLHYNSKDDLLMDCYEGVVSYFDVGLLSREELLSPEPPPGLVALHRHYQDMRVVFHNFRQGKDGDIVLRRVRERSAQAIEDSLRAAFCEDDSAIPFNLLANYLAGAQIALLQWWFEKRMPYTPEHLARTFHRLQRAAICDALGIEK